MQEHAARALALAVAERGDIDAFGPAVHGVRPRVAGLLGHLLGLDHLDDLGVLRDRAWCRGCGCARSAGPAPPGSAARRGRAARWGTGTTSRRSSRSGAARRRRWASPSCRRSANRYLDLGSTSTTAQSRRGPCGPDRRRRRRRASRAGPSWPCAATGRSWDRVSRSACRSSSTDGVVGQSRPAALPRPLPPPTSRPDEVPASNPALRNEPARRPGKPVGWAGDGHLKCRLWPLAQHSICGCGPPRTTRRRPWAVAALPATSRASDPVCRIGSRCPVRVRLPVSAPAAACKVGRGPRKSML